MGGREAIFERLSWRTPLYSPDVPFAMCWSQKAGCTGVLKWFLFHAGLLQDAMSYEAGKSGRVAVLHRYENEVLKKAPGYRDALADALAKGLPAFCFLRCPFERAFSSYLHLHNPLDALYPNRQSPTIQLRRALLRWRYGREVPLDRVVSFAEYLAWLQLQDMHQMEPHHRPQYHPLYDHITVSFYRLEGQRVTSEALENRFGLESTQDMAADLFDSGHHHPKQRLSAKATLAFLHTGLPMQRAEDAVLPKVTRALLEPTDLGQTIAALYAQDIAAYDDAR